MGERLDRALKMPLSARRSRPLTGGQVRRLHAERDRLKAPPAEPVRRDEQPTGDLYAYIYQALAASKRGAWLASHGFVVHATKKEVSVIQGDVRGAVRLG